MANYQTAKPFRDTVIGEKTMRAALPFLIIALGLASCSREPHGHGAHGVSHGHGHRFENAEQWASHFEDPARDTWQRPDVVIGMLSLNRDSVVADIGAATGYFPTRIAPHVPDGRVIGVDIEPDMVRFLNERARREGLTNLVGVLGKPDDPHLTEKVDLMLMVNTIHHIEHRSRYFRTARSYLRPEGRVVVVDFKKGRLPVGPPDEMKLEPTTILRELESAGYRLVSENHTDLPYQFALVFSLANNSDR